MEGTALGGAAKDGARREFDRGGRCGARDTPPAWRFGRHRSAPAGGPSPLVPRGEGEFDCGPMMPREGRAPSGLALLAHLPQNCWEVVVWAGYGALRRVQRGRAYRSEVQAGATFIPSPACGRGCEPKRAGEGPRGRQPDAIRRAPDPSATPTSPGSLGGGASISERRGRRGCAQRAALPPDESAGGPCSVRGVAAGYSTTAVAAPMRARSFSTSSTTRRGSIGLAR